MLKLKEDRAKPRELGGVTQLLSPLGLSQTFELDPGKPRQEGGASLAGQGKSVPTVELWVQVRADCQDQAFSKRQMSSELEPTLQATPCDGRGPFRGHGPQSHRDKAAGHPGFPPFSLVSHAA